MTSRQPKHAQPSVLAGLRWSVAAQWVGLAVLIAFGVGVLTTVDAPARPAAARAAAPPAVVVGGSSGVPGDATLVEQPPAAVSLAPVSTTFTSPPAGSLGNTQASSLAADGIPATALQAYEQAADRELLLHPACGLSWPLLAGIGRAESNHGRFAGAVLHTDGISTPRVIGIPLNGIGTASILDTDNGRLDGDAVYDRAVGPMQFIPSTWAGYGVDANNDGVADPFNMFDAAAGAANYLCAAGGDLTTLAGQIRAVRVYNDSDDYIELVLQLEAIYASGVPGLTVPVLPTDPTPSPPRATVPPANPGPPLGVPKPKPKPKPSPKPAAPSTSSSTHTESPCPTPTSTSTEPQDPSTSATASPTTSTSGTTSGASTTSSASASTTSTASTTPSPTGTQCATPTPTGSTTDTGTPTPTDTTSSPGTPTSSSSTSPSPPGESTPG